MARPRRNRTGRPGRPQTPPPILRRRASEPFEGADLLDEIGREQGALALWQALRDVLLWAFAAPGERREGLFAVDAQRTAAALQEGAEMDAEISLPLHELFAVCISPGTVKPEPLVDSCQRISRWAEEKGLRRAALAYAYAAAVISPGAPEHAYRVGLLARKEADHARGEAWFRRAIGLARRNRDVPMQTTALLSLGNLFVWRGDYQRAEMALRKALRLARRHGLRELRGKALHDLCVVAFETGQFEKAERFAYQAYKAYRRGHPLLPILAHDVAAFWLLQGKFQRALDIFQAAFSLMRRQPQQLWILGTIAHAAGGAGRREDFTSAWVQAWRIIDSQLPSESTGPALLNLAYGAVHLEDWERVETASSLAIATSIRRQETRVREEAEALLQSAQRKGLTTAGAAMIYPPRGGEMGDALASQLLVALDGMRG
jgi:tetratricopeptide (TPR) repeat protein